jgi:hypothetical protein
VFERVEGLIQLLQLRGGNRLGDAGEEGVVFGQHTIQNPPALGRKKEAVVAAIIGIGPAFDEGAFFQAIKKTADVSFGDEKAFREFLLRNAVAGVQRGEDIELRQRQFVPVEELFYTANHLGVGADYLYPRHDRRIFRSGENGQMQGNPMLLSAISLSIN